MLSIERSNSFIILKISQIHFTPEFSFNFCYPERIKGDVSKTCACPHSNSHNQKVQMHMMDLMSSIITEGDGVTQELLDTILINLIPAHKVDVSSVIERTLNRLLKC